MGVALRGRLLAPALFRAVLFLAVFRPVRFTDLAFAARPAALFFFFFVAFFAFFARFLAMTASIKGLKRPDPDLRVIQPPLPFLRGGLNSLPAFAHSRSW
jgi:hypothetical protein